MDIRGEFAYQFGEYDGDKSAGGYAGQDRKGYGGYIFGKRKFADMTLKLNLSFGLCIYPEMILIQRERKLGPPIFEGSLLERASHLYSDI